MQAVCDRRCVLMNVLTVENLCKSYPAFELKHISFQLGRGKITGFSTAFEGNTLSGFDFFPCLVNPCPIQRSSAIVPPNHPSHITFLYKILSLAAKTTTSPFFAFPFFLLLFQNQLLLNSNQ